MSLQGYKAARPLQTKKASEVAERLRDIYKAGPLTWPKKVQIDNNHGLLLSQV